MTESPGFLTIERIRQAEKRALESAPSGALMRQAALAVAQLADTLLQRQTDPAPVSALVGPGNNGADALLALMMLAARGYAVRAFSNPGERSMPPDAAHVHTQWLAQGGSFTPLGLLSDHLPALPQRHAQRGDGLIIDGLFGIGLQRPLQADAAAAAQLTHRLQSPVIAVDVPSGLNAGTGAVVGGERAAVVAASHTVTMIANKPGLHTGTGRQVSGIVTLAGLNVDTGTPDGLLIDQAWVRPRLSGRAVNSHKGSFGFVAVLGGARAMPGASLLAGNGALASGAGKVALISPDQPVFDPGSPQLMAWHAREPAELHTQLKPISTLVAGCGLGTTPLARALLAAGLGTAPAAVVDADALNLIASTDDGPTLKALLIERAGRCPTILTPHPLEAARLLGLTVVQVQNDRIRAALSLAEQTRCTVVLKGAGSIVAAPDGRHAINTSGGPALATGGTGDMLAGVIGGLLAQGHTSWEAAAIGTWAHGHAADRWAIDYPRGTGLNTSQLAGHLVKVLNTC